jgi:hypothetical protein
MAKNVAVTPADSAKLIRLMAKGRSVLDGGLARARRAA